MSNNNFYYCPKCHAITERESDKVRVRSFCDESGKSVFIQKVVSADSIATKLRRVFLKNNIRLEECTRKEQLLFKMTFEQGAKVAINSFINGKTK